MLKDLLSAVATGNYLFKPSLAEQLDQPVSMIEAGLDQLVRLGYLSEDSSATSENCDLACGKCPYASMCQSLPIKTFSVTEKGQAFLANH